MKIIVTGGAGFIGSHLVDRLIQEKHQVVILDNLSTGKKENINKKAKFYQVDISSNKIKDIFAKEKPEIVFHTAAQIDLRKSISNPEEDVKINVLGSLNLLQSFLPLLVKNKSKFIFTSTGGAIYGEAKVLPTPESYLENPLSPYGIEKLMVDKFLHYYHQVFGLAYASLRLANVYGPRQNSKGEAGVIAIFVDKMLSSQEVVINGSGRQTRDFIFVADVVEAALLAMKSEKSGIYNIGTAQETNIKTIFKKLKNLLNLKVKETYSLAKLGEQKKSCLDSSKAKKELAWIPSYDLDKGLKETIQWFLDSQKKV